MAHDLIGRPCILQPAHYLPGMAPRPQRILGNIINEREPGIVRVRDTRGSTHDRVRLLEDDQQPPPLGLWCRLDKLP